MLVWCQHIVASDARVRRFRQVLERPTINSELVATLVSFMEGNGKPAKTSSRSTLRAI